MLCTPPLHSSAFQDPLPREQWERVRFTESESSGLNWHNPDNPLQVRPQANLTYVKLMIKANQHGELIAWGKDKLAMEHFGVLFSLENEAFLLPLFHLENASYISDFIC